MAGPDGAGILLEFLADVPPLLAQSRGLAYVEVFILLLMSVSSPHSRWAPQQWRMEMTTVVLIKGVLVEGLLLSRMRWSFHLLWEQWMV